MLYGDFKCPSVKDSVHFLGFWKNSVNFVNIDESVTTMYPLLEPALEDIEKQLCNNVPISEVSTNDNSKYTQTLLLETIEETLEKATLSK